MAQKPLYEPIRAIKHPLKILLLGVFILLGLFFFNRPIWGAVLFEDSFEDCEVGQYLQNAGCDWNDSIGSWLIINQECVEGENCVFGVGQSTSYARRGGSVDLATGTLGFWFIFENASETEHLASFYLLKDAYTNQLTHLGFWGDDLRIYKLGPTYQTIFPNVSENEWHYLQIEWDAWNYPSQSRAKVGLDGDWTDWITTAYTRPGVRYFYAFMGGGTSANGYVNLDYFKENPNDFNECCSDFCGNCETFYTCQKANCCWYYSYWLHQNFCVSCPTGDCASSIYECQNCLTEENCVAQEYCYWFEGGCRYGTGQCNEGLELQFCENEEDCENAGGFWYEDYCWLDPKPSLIDWFSYYDEYGDYETSSEWISNVASSTAGFFESIGGFLATFKRNFDLDEAYQRGKDFGSALPIARGYLGILNDFLGGLPFSEFFIFILVFMLAVGTFRIVRNLVQLLKFW